MTLGFKRRLVELEKIEDLDNEHVRQQRGRDFEKLILDVFDHHGLLLRKSYHTADNRAEQIDGAVEFANQIALVEVKWKESNIAASDLYSFCGKIDNKFLGTIGIFVSKEALSDNFLNSLSKGRKQSVIVIHGDDVDSIMDEGFPLEEYLIHVRQRLSMDNINYLAIKDFLQQRMIMKETIQTPGGTIRNECKALILEILSTERRETDGLIIEIKSNCSKDEELFILDHLIEEVRGLNFSMLYAPVVERNNRILQIVYRLLENPDLARKSWDVFLDQFEKSPRNYVTERFFERYRSCIDGLEGEDTKRFSAALVNAWKVRFGDWYAENVLADVTDRLWHKIEDKHKDTMFKMFFEILVSDRRETYPQKQVARKRSDEAARAEPERFEKSVLEWVTESVRHEHDNYDKRSHEGKNRALDIEINAKIRARAYDELRKLLEMREDEWAAKILDIYERLFKTK